MRTLPSTNAITTSCGPSPPSSQASRLVGAVREISRLDSRRLPGSFAQLCAIVSVVGAVGEDRCQALMPAPRYDSLCNWHPGGLPSALSCLPGASVGLAHLAGLVRGPRATT